MLKKLWSKMATTRVGSVLLILAMLAIVVVQQAPRLNSNLRDMFTVGTVQAVGIADQTCDGTADNTEVQLAVTALPATGGRVYILTGTYVWANGVTVTDASPAVTISGTGYGTYITAGDGVTSPFTAGANNWVLENMRVNVTSAVLLASMGATTGWEWHNVTTSDGYYAYRTDDATTASSWNIPTGREATYTIADEDVSDTVKAQVDLVLANPSTSDETQINAALVTLNGYSGRPLLVLIGEFECGGTIVPQSDVDVEIQGTITITMTSATVGIVFNNITNSIWSGGTITRAGTINPTGLSNTISFMGTCDETLILQNMTVGSTIIDAVTEQNGAIRLVAGSPTLRHLTVTSSDGATGAVPAALLIGGFGNKPLIDGGVYRGGGGNQNCGIFAQDGTNAIINNVVSLGNLSVAVSESNGFMSWDMASPTVNNITAIAGNGTSYAYGGRFGGGAGSAIVNGGVFSGGINEGGIRNAAIELDNSVSPVITGTTMKPQEVSKWFSYDDANDGRFIPFADHRYQLIAMYRYCWASPAIAGGRTLSIGTSAAGTQIVTGVALTNAVYTPFDLLTRPNIAANTYMYATPSGAVDDGAFFIGYTVAYDSGYQIGLIIDTMGLAKITGCSIFGTRNGYGVEIGASALAAKHFTVSDCHIENYNIAGAGNAIAVYSDSGSFPNAPFDGCTLVGNPPTASIPYFSGSNNTSSGYVLSSETKCVTGTLTAGNANAIAFAWQNPDKNDVLSVRVVVEITTAGGTPASVIQVGRTTSLAGAGLNTDFFTAIPANTPAVYDSWNATDTGTQTKWIQVIRIPAGGLNCIVGQILTQNAASLAGRYYICYTGRQ